MNFQFLRVLVCKCLSWVWSRMVDGKVRLLKHASLVVSVLAIGLFAGLAINLGEMTWLGSQVFWTGLFSAFVVLVTLLVLGYVAYRLAAREIGQPARRAMRFFYVWLVRSRSHQKWHRSVQPRLPQMLPLVLAYLAFAGPAALIIAVLVNLVAIASLGVNRLQADRMGKQNTLIEQQTDLFDKQNMIAALEQRFDNQSKEAQRRFDQIVRILEESKSPEAQEYALLSLPDAMLMAVEVIRPEWVEWVELKSSAQKSNVAKPPDKTLIEYPNLSALAQRLVAFARQGRITEKDDQGNDVPSGRVSTALCRSMHRLGYGLRQPTFGTCVWDLVFDVDGTLLPPAKSLQGCKLNADLQPNVDFQTSLQRAPNLYLDLRHIRPNQFEGAHLESASLIEAQLQGRHLHRVYLQGANLTNAHLEGARLERAQLQGAILAGAHLQNADLFRARLTGADLRNARLETAILRGAWLHCAQLDNANLRAANLSEAQLKGAILCGAYLQGTILVEARLDGADLTGADLRTEHAQWVETALPQETNRTVLVFASERDTTTVSTLLPAAVMKGCTGGSVAVVDWERVNEVDTEHVNGVVDSERMNSVSEQFRWFIAQKRMNTLVWENHDEAITTMKSAADRFTCDMIKMRATTLTGTKMCGVFIDENALHTMSKEGAAYPTLGIFPEAVTNVSQVNKAHTDWRDDPRMYAPPAQKKPAE